MDIFEVHHSKKKVRCKICECWLPSNSGMDKVRSTILYQQNFRLKNFCKHYFVKNLLNFIILYLDHIKTDHINGKSHKQKCEFKEKQNLMLLRSVYVRGFDPLLKNLESRLESLFDQFGGKVKDIYVDKNSVRMVFDLISVKDSIITWHMLCPRLKSQPAQSAN